MLPGVYRLRLPLPWPGVPHCNAWAVASRRRLRPVRHRHARSRNRWRTSSGRWRCAACASRTCGWWSARTPTPTTAGRPPTIVERAGCELWMHPSHELMNRMVEDPEAVLRPAPGGRPPERRAGGAAAPLRRRARATADPGIVGPIEPDRDLVTGVTVGSDLGEWVTYETPGHAPSHVCLFQPERRLLISGDHLLGRISLYFEYGYSPDPVGEFLSSLDVVERLGARLCLAGHGRTFTDVHAHIHGNRALVRGATRRACCRRSAQGADGLRDRAARLRRLALRAERPLAALADARLPDASGGDSARSGASPASPSAGRHNQTMRIDEILAGERPGRSRSSSSRRRPRRASGTCTRRSPS